MRILWLANVPSPYRVDFFNELGKQCELTVLFEKKTSDERDKSWLNYSFQTFKGIFLRGKSINTDSAICPEVVSYVKGKTYDHVVVTNYYSPTGIIAVFYMRAHHIPYWIEGDGGFAKIGNGIKSRMKTFMISGSKGCFSTSKAHDEYYLAYGATKENIHRYPFTSIKKDDLINASALVADGKLVIREKLGMTEKRIILSVGRFTYDRGYGKGFDILMKVAESLRDDYGFYIVGDQPTQEFIEWKEKENLNNVNYISYISKEELSYYYAASDGFVLLTRGDAWGLVINEAMVYGLPIITTPYCIAGTELVEDYVNGFLVDLDDVHNIVEKVKNITHSDNNYRYSLASREKIENYTIEQMVNTHMTIFSRK